MRAHIATATHCANGHPKAESWNHRPGSKYGYCKICNRISTDKSHKRRDRREKKTQMETQINGAWVVERPSVPGLDIDGHLSSAMEELGKRANALKEQSKKLAAEAEALLEKRAALLVVWASDDHADLGSDVTHSEPNSVKHRQDRSAERDKIAKVLGSKTMSVHNIAHLAHIPVKKISSMLQVMRSHGRVELLGVGVWKGTPK